MNSLFDFPQVQINKKIRLIELFGGIGSQAMALRNIGADFEHYRLVEFDKYACMSYNAIHGSSFEPTDIRTVHAADLGISEKDKYCYILTYSFPCTDLSVAGKMQGMSKADWEEGHSTRSGLLWEVWRILKELKKRDLPQILLMENVPQVHAEQNKADFDNWLEFLRSRGYHNFWRDLNAKDYGIPQNRERCFMVSVLSDEFVEYEFPKPIPLEKVMKDYLESRVDEKYYINTDKAKKLIEELIENGTLEDCEDETIRNIRKYGNGKAKYKPFDGAVSYPLHSQDFCRTGFMELAPTLAARDYKDQKITVEKVDVEDMAEVKVIGQMDNTIDHTFESANRVYDKDGLCPTIPTCAGGGLQPKIIEDTKVVRKIVKEKTNGFFDKAWKTAEKGNAEIGDTIDAFNGKVNKSGISPTITTRPEGKKTAILPVVEQYRIRKLTPREVWRLMAFSDEDFDKAASVVSNTQLYKQAGNSIVVTVLEAIFSQMNIKGVKPWNEVHK